MTKSQLEEFNTKWGKMCLVDDMGGHYIGSYVIEFIEGLLAQQREEDAKVAEGMTKEQTTANKYDISFDEDINGYNNACDEISQAIRSK